MSFTKVTDEDRNGKGVSGLPDVPQLSTSDMQAKFDELGNVGIDALNNLIDELEEPAAAASIGAVVPTGLVANANVGSIIAALTERSNDLLEDAHTHDNKDTLDAITSDVKTDYDRISSMLQNINTVNNGVQDASDVIPTGHAIVQYVSRLGGGDMLKATYDSDDDGIVDNAEAVQGHTVTSSSTAITNPDASTGNQIPTAGAINEVYQALDTDVNSRILKSSIMTEQGSSNYTVPASSLLKSVSDSLGSSITSLSNIVAKQVDKFVVKGATAQTIQTKNVSLTTGKLYFFVLTCHRMTTNKNAGEISGTVGVTMRYMDRYERISSGVSSWTNNIVTQNIVTPNSNIVLTNNNSGKYVEVKPKTGYMVNCTVYAIDL